MIREKLKRLFSNAECSPFEREVRRRLTWRVILLAISPLPLLLLLIHFLYLRVMFNSESIIDLRDRNVNMAIAFLSVVFYVMINRMKQQRFVAERYERDGVRRRDAEDQ